MRVYQKFRPLRNLEYQGHHRHPFSLASYDWRSKTASPVEFSSRVLENVEREIEPVERLGICKDRIGTPSRSDPGHLMQ